MGTSNFLDANVWLALAWSRHVHAAAAGRWFEESAHENFSFCRLTQLTVLRLLTTERILGSDTKTMAGAWKVFDQLQLDRRIMMLDEPGDLQAELRTRTQLPTRSPKVWADAYLLAFATTAGLKLVTFDRALKARGAEVLVL